MDKRINNKKLIFMLGLITLAILSGLWLHMNRSTLFPMDKVVEPVFGAVDPTVENTSDTACFSAQNPRSVSYTASTCDNAVLVVGSTASQAVTSATYNGVSLTKAVGRNQSGEYCDIWYLANPDAGSSYTLSVSYGAFAYGEVGVATLCGVDTSDPLDTVASGGSDAAGVFNMNIVTGVDDAILVDNIHVAYSFGSGYIADSPQVEINNSDSCSQGEGGSSYENTNSAGTYNMGWDWTSTFNNDDVSYCIASFNPVPSGAAPEADPARQNVIWFD